LRVAVVPQQAGVIEPAVVTLCAVGAATGQLTDFIPALQRAGAHLTQAVIVEIAARDVAAAAPRRGRFVFWRVIELPVFRSPSAEIVF
jgi:hypothetical protein